MNTYCGIFIKRSSQALIPFARTYNLYEWEASPGPHASPSSGIDCTTPPGNECDIELPTLSDVTDSYIILAMDRLPDKQKQIASFLEMTSFGPKMEEITSLESTTILWDDSDRATFIRNQIDMPATSHREYYRERTNTKWDASAFPARVSCLT